MTNKRSDTHVKLARVTDHDSNKQDKISMPFIIYVAAILLAYAGLMYTKIGALVGFYIMFFGSVLVMPFMISASVAGFSPTQINTAVPWILGTAIAIAMTATFLFPRHPTISIFAGISILVIGIGALSFWGVSMGRF